MNSTTYRKVGDMTADQLLSVLTDQPQFQINLFVKMGGDPDDHNYARLSYLTSELRKRGVIIHSSKTKGIWLGQQHLNPPPPDLDNTTLFGDPPPDPTKPKNRW